jgi:hypothetical protein
MLEHSKEMEQYLGYVPVIWSVAKLFLKIDSYIIYIEHLKKIN